ncbi:MAG: RNA polymerase sigma factor SigJ [Acidimicrobiales bacterium]
MPDPDPGPVAPTPAVPDGDEPAASMTEVFTAARARLVGLAYRITGSRIDAEDLVQEAWLRARHTDWTTIERPEAWLTTVVSRLALDHLRSAAHRRETYVGPWLPEPVLSESLDLAPAAAPDPAAVTELSESLTFGFLRLLETLSPVERVVFLLAEVFQTPYDDIAAVVDRSPENCRQIATRARRHVQAGRPRHDTGGDAARVVRGLLVAVGQGDIEQAVALLADDAVLVSDGGAATHAARRPVEGADKVARFLVNLARRYWMVRSELVEINGEPGMVSWLDDKVFWAVSAEVRDGVVSSIHTIRNPDKLAALDITTPML